MDSAEPPAPSRWESRVACALFAVCLLFSAWAEHVGWESKRLLGFEYRQAQTALSAYWIKAEHNFSLAYPTPVLGKSWSVPMEFPLYQWTAVAVGDATGWGLVKSGRATGIACFYLCLPAVFLLLARWQVPPGRRWPVLALVVTSPFYLFYARGFLIETMALMFSLWFWVAYERAVAARSYAWLALAALAGTGAGLVKVTTFLLYLLPPAVWSVRRLWARRHAGGRQEFAWMAAAVALPVGATLGWLYFSDAVKAANPMARFLTAEQLVPFNFGTLADRLAPKYWLLQLRIVREELSWPPALALAGAALFLPARDRRAQIAGCLLAFASVLVVFPILYALHDYYYAANTLLLLLALGLAVVALAETRMPRAVVFAVVLLVAGGQASRYLGHQYLEQRQVLPPGSWLTEAVQELTQPDDVIVILGQDWNSMVPYYAQRRALMVREDAARHPELVAEALARLDGERIGALLVEGEPLGREWLVAQLAARGLSATPVFRWHDVAIYVPESGRKHLLNRFLDRSLPEVTLAAGVEQPREGLANQWREVASLRAWQRRCFQEMHPEPVRYYASFGPNADASSGRFLYNAHPDTDLVFALPAGRHVLRTTLEMPADTWSQPAARTDGVQVTLYALAADGTRRQLGGRFFDPVDRPEDRAAACPLAFEFSLPAAGEVELEFGPGPKPDYSYDRIMVGALTIQ